MLSDIIDENLIQLRISSTDWEDAIRKSAYPLFKNGKITASYIDAMIDNVKEAGPYIAITKHVALPHARPQDGAKEIALAISTLEKPVNIGNKDNDPIKYIFCLSALDSESHIQAMSQLVKLLEKNEFYNILDRAKSPKEVMEYIRKHEQIGNKDKK